MNVKNCYWRPQFFIAALQYVKSLSASLALTSTLLLYKYSYYLLWLVMASASWYGMLSKCLSSLSLKWPLNTFFKLVFATLKAQRWNENKIFNRPLLLKQIQRIDPWVFDMLCQMTWPSVCIYVCIEVALCGLPMERGVQLGLGEMPFKSGNNAPTPLYHRYHITRAGLY